MIEAVKALEEATKGFTDIGCLTPEQQAFADKYTVAKPIPTLKHPLYIEPFFAPTLGRVRLAMAKVHFAELRLERQLSSGNYGGYVFAHERPFRLEAFAKVSPLINDQHTYWELLSDLWVDSEAPCYHESNRIAWRELWLGGFNNIEPLAAPCSECDKEEYAAIPDRLTVYRGGDKHGYSWTLSKDKAHWFAKRNVEQNKADYELWEVEIGKDEIQWYSGGRGESEAVILSTKNDPKQLERL